MIQLINKMKRKDGFTLVELIVVLVILAILAAFTIPAMLGYINDAREKAGLAEARASLIAAQATVDNIYGPMTDDQRGKAVNAETTESPLAKALDGYIAIKAVDSVAVGDFVSTGSTLTDVFKVSTIETNFNKYASGDLTDGAAITDVAINTDGQITAYTYVLTDYTYKYASDTWTIEETTAANTALLPTTN